tara:strand:- start:329 stop:1204 length:876 start_codon:yes stop_codon:yes gene_type:complete
MKILVTGKDGQLGSAIYKKVKNKSQKHNFIFVGKDELNLANKESVHRYFEKNIYDLIINCAAYTSVDKAEAEPEIADAVNNFGVKHIAKFAKINNSKLIHISTDYVFDGASKNSYKEDHQTSPINVYGKSKLDGEKAIQNEMELDSIIIRTSWVYSEYGKNFVKTILNLAKEKKQIDVINDQFGSPTNVHDLARAIFKIIENIEIIDSPIPSEIYHFSNEGTVSWYEFAKEIINIKNINCIVNPVSTQRFKTAALRPANSSMDISKIKKKYDIDSVFWHDSLKVFLENNII